MGGKRKSGTITSEPWDVCMLAGGLLEESFQKQSFRRCFRGLERMPGTPRKMVDFIHHGNSSRTGMKLGKCSLVMITRGLHRKEFSINERRGNGPWVQARVVEL